MEKANDLPEVVDKIVQLAEVKRVSQIIEKSMPGLEEGRNGLLITSAIEGEGKTIISAGLGVRIAHQSNIKVLLVDLNWRSPGLHKCFQKKQNYEYSDLISINNPQRLIKKTDFSKLDILTAPFFQHPDSSRDLTKEMIEVLKKLAVEYERVILDCAPLFPINRQMMDPMAFAAWTGGTIFVSMGGHTPRDIAKKAVVMLDSTDSRLMGVFMNQWKNPLG